MDGRGRGGLLDLAAATVEEELNDVACPRGDLGGRHRRAQPHRAPMRHRDELLCEIADGSEGQLSILPIVGWVTLTESSGGTVDVTTWSWYPMVLFEHELRLGRTVPHYRGTAAKDVIGKVALGLVKSRFVAARDVRRSHSPIWSSNIAKP